MKWLWALAFVTACKGDPQKCERALRNYMQLVYWEKADAEIAAAPAEKRDALRKDKLAEFEREMQQGLQTVTTQCVSANNDDTVNCMIGAKTAAQAKACVDD